MSKELTKDVKTTTVQEVLATNNDYGIEFTLWATCRDSIFPGAKPESIKMAIDYCFARKLDILLKPVHIVPMNVKNSKTGVYEWRDVIMPGIGLYRTQAFRTGEYMGLSEPEYGPLVTTTMDGVKISYPEWCKLTVKRFIKGQIAEFTALEFWTENYAVAAAKTSAPNTMWKKRPYAQLAKCVEAQALRKGFPNEVGSAPTAEEMEGKMLDDIQYEEIKSNYTSKAQMLSEKLSVPLENPIADIVNNADVPDDTSPEPIAFELAVKTNRIYVELVDLISKHSISAETQAKWCHAARVLELHELPLINMEKCVEWIKNKYEKIEDEDIEDNEKYTGQVFRGQ